MKKTFKVYQIDHRDYKNAEASHKEMRRLAREELLAQAFAFTKEEVVFMKVNDFGKPYVDWEFLREKCTNSQVLEHENCGKQFNISHDKNFSVLAIADEEVGVDIEAIPSIRERETGGLCEESKAEVDSKRLHRNELIANRVFPNLYKKAYESADEEEKSKVFTELWTKLEAVLKAEGRGFHLDPLQNGELFEHYETETFWIEDHAVSVAMRKTLGNKHR